MMPGFDGSGPRGGGPMTGWGRGFCSRLIGKPNAGFPYLPWLARAGRFFGRRYSGFGLGRGRGGRGRRNRWW